MMQSFRNFIRKRFFQALSDPLRALLIILIILIITALLMAFFLKNTLLLEIALLFNILYVAYSLAATLIKKPLTPNFCWIKHFGRNYIYQDRKNKARKTCVKKTRAGMKDVNLCEGILNYEIENLPNKLPEGQYVALTHDFVIQILEGKGIKIRRTPAYKSDLLSLQNSMYGCRGCALAKECWIRKEGKSIRPFYYIRFKINGQQPHG